MPTNFSTGSVRIGGGINFSLLFITLRFSDSFFTLGSVFTFFFVLVLLDPISFRFRLLEDFFREAGVGSCII